MRKPLSHLFWPLESLIELRDVANCGLYPYVTMEDDLRQFSNSSQRMVRLNGFGSVASFLASSNTRLRVLHLSNCRLGAWGLPKIAEIFLENRTVKELDVSGNGICDVGAKLLFEALEFNVVLTDLKIGTNQISDEWEFKLYSLMARNKLIVRAVRRAVLYLIGVRKGPNRDGMGVLAFFPREIVKMIAVHVYNTRTDPAWIEVTKDVHR